MPKPGRKWTAGPAAQFDQDAILEFQVLTAGYKAEFGTRLGGDRQRRHEERKRMTGMVRFPFFHRNYLLDSPDCSRFESPVSASVGY